MQEELIYKPQGARKIKKDVDRVMDHPHHLDRRMKY
jgi:hypothetical protein